MNENQTYEQNKAAFIKRLMDAGWPQDEAETEWEMIQNDDEGGL